MQYVALVGEKELPVEISESAGNCFQVVVDGRSYEVDAQAVSDSTLSMIIADQSYNIESERLRDGSENLLVRGASFHIEVLDLRTMSLRHAQQTVSGPQGPATILSPMPGKIVAVLVSEGQQVVEGQGLVVVEAMKMENELRAPRSGVVKNLAAVAGTAVEGGAQLCVVE
jgi:biotin carboxyl carrier protein